MDHVQLLLLLESDQGQGWSRDKLLTESKLVPAIADVVLQDLVASGLVATGREPDGESYRYAPPTEETKRDVSEIAALYNERPVTLVRAVYDKPPEPAVSFADAFSIRKDD
jgi:hypothetical protein